MLQSELKEFNTPLHNIPMKNFISLNYECIQNAELGKDHNLESTRLYSIYLQVRENIENF